MARKSKHTSPGGTAETLGRRLARLRKAAGLSQAQLAARLGTVQTLVSEYELDRRRIHAQRLAEIARLLHVSVDELVGLKPTKVNGALSLKLVRRLREIDQLSPARQKTLLQMVDAFLRDAKRA